MVCKTPELVETLIVSVFLLSHLILSSVLPDSSRYNVQFEPSRCLKDRYIKCNLDLALLGKSLIFISM